MRKLLLAGLVAGSLVAGAGLARADSRAGSSESSESAPYECPSEANPEGTGPGADDPGDCGPGETTYTVTEHTNDVDCTDESTVPAQEGIAVSVNGDPNEQWIEAEVCNDGDTGPIQGRALVGGSFEEEGVHATADGDKDNPSEAQGWVTAAIGVGGPSVTCGDDNGNLDATETTDDDGQEDCPAPPAP